MTDEKTPEQKLHTELCQKISDSLDGHPYGAGLDALADVTAQLCAEQNYPESAALAQIQTILHFLVLAVEEIETTGADTLEPN